MQSLSRTRFLAGLALLAAALLLGGTARGQAAKAKANAKGVSFQTSDFVKIEGELYPAAAGGKKEGVVMMLHDFDLKNGGGSQVGEWPKLAATLQAQGYTVLTFDFRGFGNSKQVDKDFWTVAHNNPAKGFIKPPKRFNPNAPPETVSHNEFRLGYLPYLVNDIAAAKAYLDRRNDAKDLNSGNLVVIGAGHGATLGAMWLANECRRKRDTNVPPALMPTLTPQPEISDVACAVWLSIKPSVGVRVPLRPWIMEAGRKHKVPMAFIFGKSDSTGDQLARSLDKAIKGNAGAKSKDFPNTGFYAVPGSKLTGVKLLASDGVDEWTMKYLDKVLEARGSKEQKDRKSESSQYWYVWPMNPKNIRKLSKKAGQEAPQVDVASLMQGQ
jgi:hypothetical protein